MILKSSVPHRYWARKVIFRSINPLNVSLLVGFITIPIRYDSTRAKNEKEDGIEDHGSKELTSFVQHTRHIGRKMWGTWRLTYLSLFRLGLFGQIASLRGSHYILLWPSQDVALAAQLCHLGGTNLLQKWCPMLKCDATKPFKSEPNLTLYPFWVDRIGRMFRVGNWVLEMVWSPNQGHH